MKKLTSALLSVVLAAPALAAPCGPVLQSYLTWVKSPGPGHTRSLGFTLTSLAASGKSEYAEGTMSNYTARHCGQIGSAYACWPESISTDSDQNPQVYGNWSCVMDLSGPGFHSCLNPFNEGPDRAHLTLAASTFLHSGGGLTMGALTPGITTAKVPLDSLSCENGVMSGFSTGASPTLFAITLSELDQTIPR